VPHTHPVDDRFIDAVARQMTVVAPSIDLRARVLERLADRQPAWLPALPAVVAATAAVVIVTGALAWSLADRVDGRLQLAQAPVVTAPAVAWQLPGPSPVPAVVVDVRPSATRPAIEVVTEPGFTAAELAWLGRTIPSLPDIVPVAIDQIQPEQVGIPLLDMKPLAPEPLTLRPLGIGASR